MWLTLLLDDDQLICEIRNQALEDETIVNMNDDTLLLFINKLVYAREKDGLNEVDFDRVYDLSRQVFYRIRGLGVLENYIEDESINEIMVNDIDQIFVERAGKLESLSIKIESREEYLRIINKIVNKSGREVNLSNPIVDARLDDGSRVNIVLSPIALNQAALTIRKFPKKTMDMDFLLGNGTVNQELMNFLSLLVRSKYNLLISGGTSSGKTSFLNALSEYIGENERIITIEDSRELQLINKKNLVSMETRNANNSSKGQIGMDDLIKTSLRMRPDRIIVGEVRGKEALEMLECLNTGHAGSMASGHANSSLDMVSRLETMVLKAGENIPLEAVKRMIASSIEYIIHLSRISKNKRRLVEISELYYQDGDICLNKIFTYVPKKDQCVRTTNKIRNLGKMMLYESLEQ